MKTRCTSSRLRCRGSTCEHSLFLPAFCDWQGIQLTPPIALIGAQYWCPVLYPIMPTPPGPHVSRSASVPATAESLHNRSYFYVGGEYVGAGRGDGQRIFAGQMYVEQLTPADGVKHPWPIVFIQGAGQTGSVSLNNALCASVASYIVRALNAFQLCSFLFGRRDDCLL